MRRCFNLSSRRRSLGIACLVLAAVLLLLPGCQRNNEPVSLGPWTGGTERVPLYVLHGHGGTTMALLKIYIDGQGPFNFVLDTGASTSGVDQSIADALHLPRAGRAVKVAGVSEVTRRGQVRVAHWRMGDHPLPPHTLVTLDMPDKGGGVRLDGLFGSDMLNLFGLVRIDYERGYLVLPARQESMVERPQSQNLASLLRWPG